MPGTPTQVQSTRYHSLDLWRGLACLSVVVFHAIGWDTERPSSEAAGVVSWVADRMWAGVPMFFVISGYCIAAAADRTQRRGLPMRDYFLRRLRRIFPPLWALFALAAVVTATAYAVGLGPTLFAHQVGSFVPIHPPSDLTFIQWLNNATLFEYWRFGVGTTLGGPFWHLLGSPLLWLVHTWTLAYEEQFYIVVGVMVIAMAGAWQRGVVLLTVTSAAMAVLIPESHQTWRGLFFDGWWLPFGIGLLLFGALHARERWSKPVFILLAVGAVAYGGPALLRTAHEHWRTGWCIAGLTGLAMLLLHPWDSELSSARLLRPLNAWGVRCFSVYLVHWPVAKALSGLAAAVGITSGAWHWVGLPAAGVAATFACAWPFHRYIERRFWTPTPELAPSASASAAPSVSFAEVESVTHTSP